MTFDVSYSNRSKKFLNPVIHDTKTVEGSKGLFRVRVGDYRILYEVDYKNNLLGIIKIDKKPRVYD
ncbi:MAG: type II toxin-antitoxin system RelE/ParE family toxin [Methanophagales archaeon]|nr:type II toxin-antitoxin system RelE/ParE family toxin [Methanophagales archaeon]